jgi:hypothetical protein
MITNPYAGAQGEDAWRKGFGFGFAGPARTDASPPSDAAPPVAPELIDTFNEGRLVGQQYAANGLPIDPEYIDASEETSSKLTETAHVLEGADVTKDFIAALLSTAKAAEHLAHGLAGGVVLLIELAVTLPHQYKTPEDVLPGLGEQFVNALADLGIQNTLDLYCAVGVDLKAAGQEFRFSPIFRSIDQARSAAGAMGRADWVIAHWRTNQCGSFELIDASH